MKTTSGIGNMDIVALLPLAQSIEAEVTVPGSKSYTIRALLLAALTPKCGNQPVKVVNPLISDDTRAIMACLNTLGIGTELKRDGSQSWIDVQGGLSDIQDQDYTLNADLSAATLRFLIALSAVIPGRQTLLGKEGLNKRPVKDLVDSLRALGVSIEYLDKDGYPPVRVSSSRIEAETVQVSGSTSSQYISALMMIAPLIQSQADAVTIELPGEPVSKPYLDMTISILEAFGVSVSHQDYQRFTIPTGQTYRADRYIVEPDASSLAYFVAITALTKSTITLCNINPDSVQADMRFVTILERMGNRAEFHDGKLTLHGVGIKPLHVDMRDCPDQAQTLAILAAFADGVTRIDGLQSLRVKETDRIAAVEKELQKMGVRTETEADALVIHGGNPKAARIATYGDHRMAMAFAVAGALLSNLEIEDPEVVNKTYPEFWQDLQAIGVGVRRIQATVLPSLPFAKKIVLTGFMGAGKSSVAAVLAQKSGLRLLEMDDLIIERSGRESINQIFEMDGETRFRQLEQAVAEALGDAGDAIVSTGGGVIMNPIAMDHLSRNATVVFLQTELETSLNRLAEVADRPLLRDPEKAAALYDLRLPLYRHHADVIVKTDAQSPESVAEEIIRAIQVAPVCSV